MEEKKEMRLAEYAFKDPPVEKSDIRFISIEPMLGPVDLTTLYNGYGETYNALTAHVKPRPDDEYTFRVSDTTPLDWVIVGGESGPGARPMKPEWAMNLLEQCRSAGVPFFMKQMSKRAPIPPELMVREFPWETNV